MSLIRTEIYFWHSSAHQIRSFFAQLSSERPTAWVRLQWSVLLLTMSEKRSLKQQCRWASQKYPLEWFRTLRGFAFLFAVRTTTSASSQLWHSHLSLIGRLDLQQSSVSKAMDIEEVNLCRQSWAWNSSFHLTWSFRWYSLIQVWVQKFYFRIH